MAKIKKPAHVDENGNHKTPEPEVVQNAPGSSETVQYNQDRKILLDKLHKLDEDHDNRKEQKTTDKNWLDELTGDQNERDKAVRETEQARHEETEALYGNPEQGSFVQPKPDFTKEYAHEDVHGRAYKPIPAKELADKIVDAVFEFIQSGEYSPNWPRVMTAIGHTQQQLRRRWREILGHDGRGRFAKRFSELNSTRSVEEKLAQVDANEAVQPENRGFEATDVKSAKRKIEPAVAPLVAPQFQIAQQKGPEPPQPDEVLEESKPEPQMGEPVPGVATPGSEML